MRAITFDLAYRAIPKANKHKVARRGSGPSAKRMVVNDLTGAGAKAEESFALRAMECVDDSDKAGLPWSCPIEAKVVFVYKTADGWSDKKKQRAYSGETAYTKTPDLENVAKFVFDALEKVFYTDDKLIYRQTLEKRYGPEERVIVTLLPYPERA